jgi:hypothetical protein
VIGAAHSGTDSEIARSDAPMDNDEEGELSRYVGEVGADDGADRW